MDTCKGLTIVTHEDLINAVDNWIKCKHLYHTIACDSVKYALDEFNKLPKIKQLYLKYTKCDWFLIFPMVTICSHGRDNILKYKREAHNGVYMELLEFSSYFYDYIYLGMIANQCERHSKYTGVHYLTDEQVLFVHKFKNLEVDNVLDVK